jgi:hypothetical protein
MLDQYKNDPPAEILDEEGKYVSPDAKYSDGEPVFTDDDLETLLTKGKLSKDSRTYTYDKTKKLRPSNIVPESVPQTTTKPTLQPVNTPNEKPFRGKLSGAEEVSVYVRIIKQIKALLKRKNIPAAKKLSSDYRNWFSDEALNITFKANVDNLLDTYVDNENTTQPNATKPNVSTSTDTNNQLYLIVSNFYRSRDVTVTSPEQMYADLKADPARKNVVRNHIRTSKNPNTTQLVALFDSKTK